MITCGIDPSRGNLAVSFIQDLKEFKYLEYENSFRGFQEFRKQLLKLSEKPAICIEGYGDFARNLALYLKEHLFTVYEINPKMSSRLKESMTIHKTDHIDSFTCGLFPFIRDDLKELHINKKIEGLKNLTRQYQKLSKISTSLKNQMHAALNQAFGPIYKEFFKDLNQTSLTFFTKFGSFKEIENADEDDLHNGMITDDCHKYKGKFGLERAKNIKNIVKNLNYCELEEFEMVQKASVKGYAEILLTIIEKKDQMKSKIEKLVEELFPNYKQFFGDVNGITYLQFGIMISEIKDIDNFSSDAKLACYSGQGVARCQSANMDKHKKNRNYNRNLAKIIHFLALNNIKKKGKYYELYEERKKIYNKKLRALKSIKRKIVRLIYYRLEAYKSFLINDQGTPKEAIEMTA